MGDKAQSPQNTIVQIDGNFQTESGDGTFVKWSRDEAARLYKVSAADGSVHVATNSNRMGKIIVTNVQTSDFNDLLSALEASGRIFSSQVNDSDGRTKVRSTKCQVEKQPDGERAKEISMVEWTIICFRIEIFTGGSNN